MGHWESKNVAESILYLANQRSGVPVTTFRLGQIAVSTDRNEPAWPEQEWVPSMIKTSKNLGLIANSIPPIDWIPVDMLATMLVELCKADYASGSAQKVYNLVNPRRATWDSLLEPIQSAFGARVKLVTLTEWISKLEQTERLEQNQLASKPALKVLDFFRQLNRHETGPIYEVGRGLETSKTMGQLEPVNQKWMEI
ncbi:hypothetical protein MMC28_010450 [Mycoblastus sanguinarius]|nr:hypothetical protein [Mycoblastus sanguinarius]